MLTSRWWLSHTVLRYRGIPNQTNDAVAHILSHPRVQLARAYMESSNLSSIPQQKCYFAVIRGFLRIDYQDDVHISPV